MTPEGKREAVIFGLLLVLLATICAGYYFAFVSDERRRARLTKEVPATVTNVYVARRLTQWGTSGVVVSVGITYQYTLGGETHTSTTVMNRSVGVRFKVGTPAKVCYDPKQVSEVELVEMNYKCGGRMSKALMAGIIVAATLVFVCGIALGLRSGYSQFAAVSFGVLPALLVVFPIARERSEGKVTFVQWVGMLFISLLLAIVINNLGAAMTVAPGN